MSCCSFSSGWVFVGFFVVLVLASLCVVCFALSSLWYPRFAHLGLEFVDFPRMPPRVAFALRMARATWLPIRVTIQSLGRGGTPRDLFTPGGRATSALPSRGAFLVARLPRSPAKKTCATTLFSRPCLTLAHHASNTTGTPSYSEKHTDFDAPPFADVHKSDFFLMRLLWFSYRPKPPKTIHFHTRKSFHKDIGQEHPTHPPARHACNLRTFTRVRKTMVFCMQNAPFPIPR